MAKKRLSKVQQRRVEAKHEQRLLSNHEQYDENLFLTPEEGIVISRYGKLAEVEDKQGQSYRCNIRRTLASIVTGDRVIWRKSRDLHTNSVIEAIHPRHSELVRPDFYDGIKTVAANVDQIMIISAVLPELSLNIIDRYLVACAVTKIEPVIVLNKIDLLDKIQQQAVFNQLAYYQSLGYRVLFISCLKQQGLEIFKQTLQAKTSILVGQSGVGKSSLIHQLLPHLSTQVSVGEVSDVSGLGQHTTTATRLYHLPSGGDIIDSPGIREFGLWHLEPQQIMQGFKEFYDYLSDCQFRDCNHLTDKNCGLQKAVANGKIAQWRLDNYHRILQTIRDVKVKTNKTFKA
ncbi:small ribosomal subunit biogenesis GTPase RsgA [Frischella sp. Ac48]|uniref:Small ribosomal subunit biogenesis GTPase RsgA n=1 Tax=Frischella japonica TaxID=2741544 RepID=A0ABR7QZ32_9GAMM|nr:small ribosomal subunit biogenesis GTPase RsgA [Frischella japonica]MBX4133936.1 small ribosomal subunit biogenesis GTPase RsgA [Frischella sp. Ac48]